VVPDGDLLVEFMTTCLRGGLTHTYVFCALFWAKPHIKIIQKELVDKLKNSTTLQSIGADLSKLNVECRYEWDARYDPVSGDVPINCVDPAAVSDDDIINAILPYLCPLDAGPGWGCPGAPNNPSGGGLTAGVGATSGGG